MALTALAIAPAAVFAQGTFPDKPINHIIPFVPGGESDIAASPAGHASKLTGKGFRGAEQGRGRRRAGLGQLNSLPGDITPSSAATCPTSSCSPLKARCSTRPTISSTCSSLHTDALVVAADSLYKTFADLAAAAKASPGKSPLLAAVPTQPTTWRSSASKCRANSR